jgi:acyl dehydratase
MPVRGAKYFEEFEEGELITTAMRTMTEADIVNFCSLTGDWNQLHSSEPFARDSHMGERVFAAQHVFSYAVGLVGRTNVFEGTIKAFLGFDDFTFRMPVNPGDTIYVEATVSETVDSPDGFSDDAGTVTLAYDIRNQHDETISTGDVRLLVFKRPAEE